MIRKKALKKIFITTLALLIILTIYLLPNIENNNIINSSLEVSYTSNIGTNNIYLLDENNMLVKNKIVLTSKDLNDKINTIINKLMCSKNNSISDKLKCTIPKNIKLLDIKIDNRILTLNFSKEIKELDEEKLELLIESVVYSIIDLDEIDGINILSLNDNIDNYNFILDKNIGINKRYNLNNREDINKVIVYYLEEIDDVDYYVPVTKYLNDSRDKIKIIIDSLTTSYIYEDNLFSLINKDLKVNSYNEEENYMLIDFNNSIFVNNDKIEEEVIYTISYSIFDNYNVNKLIFTVENSNYKEINRKDLY